MVFQALPLAGPLPLAGQATSPLLAFKVPGEVDKAFIRVIALFRDDEPLGGEAPTFQIRAAGGGLITSVGPDSGEVSIPGGHGSPVGSLGCQRAPNDIFLITIAAPEDLVFSDVVDFAQPWMVRIRNNDPESLRFLGFSSHREPDTRQPWMRLGDPNTSAISSHLELVARTTQPTQGSIEVRNWGTAPLTFDDVPGPIGAPDSVVNLKSHPGRLDPHQVGVITFEATQVNTRTDFTYQLRCNDTIEAHATLSLGISPEDHGGPVTPSDFFCREGCGCEDFLGSRTAGVCERAICGHSLVSHLPQ